MHPLHMASGVFCSRLTCPALGALLVAGLLLLAPATSSGGTIIVPDDAMTIADGIGLASYGDTVLVLPGKYYEYDLAPKPGVAIMGYGAEQDTIDAQGLGRVWDFDDTDADSQTWIYGFTFTGGSHIDGGGGMYAAGCTLTVSYCTFYDNSGGDGMGGGVHISAGAPTFEACQFISNSTADEGGGMAIIGGATPTIQDCLFRLNSADWGGGMYCSGGSVPIVIYSEFADNTSDHGAGMYCTASSPDISYSTFYSNVANFDGGGATLMNDTFFLDHCTFYANSCPGDGGGIACYDANVTLTNTIIAGSGQGKAVYGEGSTSVQLGCCDIYGNAGGDYIPPIFGLNGVNGNISADPMFCDPESEELWIHSCSPCADAPGCGLIGDWEANCYPRVWNVPGDAPTIAAALDSAAFCDTVIIATGTYHETNLVMKSGITLRSATGSFLDVTIDGSYVGRVLTCTDCDSTTTIRGITFSKGDTLAGSGMLCSYSDITIESCSFLTNTAVGSGGGLLLDNSDVKMTACSFTLNTAGDGGGVACSDSDPRLTDCTFLMNSGSTGGGMSCSGTSAPTLTNCRFDQNSGFGGGGGGAGLMFNGVSCVLDSCEFTGNTESDGDGGGIHAMSADLDLVDCVIADNTAGGWGGGIYSYGCTLAFTTSTIANNLSQAGAGISLRDTSFATLDNTVVAFNDSGYGVYCWAGSAVVPSCCDIYGNEGGDYTGCLAGFEGISGNFSEDPIFCGPGDYFLRPTSPCLDAPGCGQVGALGESIWPCGRTWWVPDDAPTIAAGIDSASAGDTVLIMPGVYYESDLQMKNGVVLKGYGGDPSAVVINAAFMGRVFYCADLDSTTLITGVEIADGDTTYGGGMVCSDSELRIENCVFQSNKAGVDGGGLHLTSSDVTLTDCTFRANYTMAGEGGGILCFGASPVLTNCVFDNNFTGGGGGGGGMSVAAPSFPLLYDCDFLVNSSGGGEGSSGGGLVTYWGAGTGLYGCTFDGNIAEGHGAAVCGFGAFLDIDNCVLTDNEAGGEGGAVFASPCTLEISNSTLAGNTGDNAVVLRSGSLATIEHTIIAFNDSLAVYCASSSAIPSCCDVYGNADGDYVGCISGYEGVDGNFSEDPLFCNPDDYHLRAASPCLSAPTCGQVGALGLGTGCGRIWIVPDDAPTIAAGIDSAVAGDTVLVMPGSYYEWDLEMKSGIVVMSSGGDPGYTGIDATASGRRVFHCNGVDSTSVIQGFWITGGDTLYGGGMLCENGSDLTISNCVFDENSAVGSGAGLRCENSDPTILNCVFSENIGMSGGGGVDLYNSDPDIAYCTFSGNYSGASGGGLSMLGSSPTVTMCDFIGNDADEGSGGGAACAGGSSPFFDGCTFTGNTSVGNSGGAVYADGSSPEFEYCVISGNSAAAGGGGVFVTSGVLTVTSCTIADNVCPSGAAIALYSTSLGFMYSTIVASNIGGEPVYCEGGSFMTPPSCIDVYGNSGGDYVGCLTGQNGINGNFSEDPKFCDPAGDNYYLHLSSPCADVMGCSQVGALGIGCGRVWNVPIDAPTIAAGIDSAAAGDTVVVECGTYYEHGLTIKSGVYLTSETGFADCVTIDSGFNAGIFYGDSVDSTTVIKGFGVTGAGDGGDTQGNGLYLTHSDPKVINCEFYGHEYVAEGPAVYCDYSSGLFANCSFHDNSGVAGAGMMLSQDSSPTIFNCDFYNNTATVYGGGIFCIEGSSPTITDCAIYNNTSEGDGGGFACGFACTTSFSRTTFALNSATGDGAAIAAVSDVKLRVPATVLVDHSIIAFSTSGAASYCAGTGNVTLTCCDVYGNAGGDYVGCFAGQNGINGNISQDPEWCAPGNGDFTLRSNSPCAAHNSGCGQMGPLGVGCESVIDWIADGDGISWSDSDNWSPPTVPGINDHARINPTWDDTVQISQNEIVWRLTVGCDSGSVVLNIPSPDTLTSTHGTTNCGTIQVFGDGAYRQVGPEDDDTFVNMDAGLFRLDNGDLIGDGEYENWGVFRKTGGLLSTVSLDYFWNASDELLRRGGYFEARAGSMNMEATYQNDSYSDVYGGAVVFVPSHRAGPALRQGHEFTNDRDVTVWPGGYLVVESGASLSNNGAFADSGVTTVSTGGQFTNEDDGTFDLADGDLLGDGQFTNWGTFLKTGDGMSRMTPDFQNASDELFRKGGYFAARSGSLDMESSVSNDGDADVNGGAVVFVPSHRGGLAERQGEQFINAGSVTVQSGAEFVVAALAVVSNTGTFADSGVTRLNTSGQFTNEAGGTFDLADGDLLGTGYFENWGDFYKTGPGMSRIEPDFLNGFDVKLRRTGYFNAVSGSTSIESGMTNDGNMDVNSGAVTFVPSHRGALGSRAASLTNSGTLTVEAGGELVNRSTTTIEAGGTLLNEGVTRTEGGALFDNYGTATIDGSGEYRNAGTTTVYSTGEFEIDVVSAKLRNLAGGDVYLDDGEVSGLYNGGTEAGGFENLGTVVKAGSGTSIISAPFKNMGGAGAVGLVKANEGILRLESTCANAGTVHVYGGALVEFDPFRIDVFENEGWLRVHGTGDFTIGGGRSDPNATFVNIGTARIDSAGQITNSGSFNHKENAVLTGEGTLDTSAGDAAIKGVIQPGSSTGVFHFIGDFFQTGTSEFAVELGGTLAGAHAGGYDQVDIVGTAVFDGSVDVALVDDFEPELADSFHVLVLNGQPAFRDTSYSGEFDCYSGLELPNDLYLEEIEQPARISLVATQVGTGNNPPGAVADEDSTYGYSPVTLWPLANDTDADDDDLRIVSVIPIPGTTHGGILIDEGDTSLTYLPEFGYEGLDTFAYSITDCRGGLDTAPFVIEITAPARTWLVPTEAPTIQAGVDSAGAGDTVLVEPGEYGPGPTRDALPVVMKSGVRLTSVGGAEVTIINADNLSRVFYCEDVDSTAAIEGFTIKNGESPGAEPVDWGGGMICLNSSPKIENCIFADNYAAVGGAVSCQNGSSPTIDGCAFEANVGVAEGGGVSCHVGSSPMVAGSTFVGNEAPVGAGLLVSGASSPAVVSCTFSENVALASGGGVACVDGSAVMIDRSIIAFSGAGEAVHCDMTSEVLVSCTDVFGNAGGDWVGCITPWATENGNFSLDPKFCDPPAGDYHLLPASPCGDALGCGLVGALPAGCMGEPGIEVEPEWMLLSSVQGGSACDTLVIANIGRSDLVWWIYESGDGEKPPIHPVPGPFEGRSAVGAASRRDRTTISFEDLFRVELAKGEPDTREGVAPVRGAGGPDTFGYTWIDSDEAGGPAFDWRDITTIGTPLTLPDDGSARVSLPFTFPYYGAGYTSIRISSNGYVTFGPIGDAYLNDPIPRPYGPNGVLAPFWEDLNPELGGTIHYLPEPQAGLFTVQYTDIQRFAATGTYTFQVILTWSGKIFFQYLDMDGELTRATIGIESPDGTVGLEIAFNAAYVHDSLAVRVIDPYPWITEAPPEGVTSGLGFETVAVCADASELTPGTYRCHLVITSNDEEDEYVKVPITLFVRGPSIDIFPESLEFTVQDGESVNDTLVVSNVGSAELDWSLSEVAGTLVMSDGRTIPVRVLPSRDGVGVPAGPQGAPKAAVPDAEGGKAGAPIRLSPIALPDGSADARDDMYPWLSQTPTSGATTEGESQEITVTVDASQMGAGEYDAYIAVDSNDLERARVTVPVVVFVVTTGVEEGEDLPAKYALHGTFPNPFNPSTTIRYDLPQRVNVTLRIYSVSGRVVRELLDGTQEPGYYAVPWNGRDDDGRVLASGVYFCRLEAGGEVLRTTMILLK